MYIKQPGKFHARFTQASHARVIMTVSKGDAAGSRQHGVIPPGNVFPAGMFR